MTQTRTVEITVGLFVAAGLAALFFLAMQVSNLANFGGGDGYRVTARFQNIGSLKARSPVTVAGVRVGQVSGIGFDEQSFEAVVELLIDPQYDTLPEDTTASILTSGLLGEQYVGLEPGGAEESLMDGAEISLTQSAMILEQLIGQFIFSKGEEAGDFEE